MDLPPTPRRATLRTPIQIQAPRATQIQIRGQIQIRVRNLIHERGAASAAGPEGEELVATATDIGSNEAPAPRADQHESTLLMMYAVHDG